MTERLFELAGYSPTRPIKGADIHRLKKVTVPAQRKAVATGFSLITASRAENLAIWDHIWNASAHREVMCQALYFYHQSRRRPLDWQEVATILGWAHRCTCWEHSDDLAKICAFVVEANPDWILPTLREWNAATGPWLRRMSITSLIEYARKRHRFLPYNEVMTFVVPLIDDREFYVQKGLGWTVREIGNAYPEHFRQFMTEHAVRLSPQAWTATIKNLDAAAKAQLMAIRKAR